MFKIKKGTIVRVFPSRQLCIVKSVREIEARDVALVIYWDSIHGIELNEFKKVIAVNFPTSFKLYEYPKTKQCLKRVFGQRSAKKKFRERRRKKL